jgi:tetrahydromethanopterin S-methyltransferase subunit G
MKSRRALTVLTSSKLDPPGALYHNGWDRAYYDQTAQEETMMAFTAMLSELYDAFRRKIGADEPPAKTAAEAVVIEDARFRSIDGKFDALNHTMDQRFDAVSQRFDVLNQPIDGLSRVMDQRLNALNHAMDQRSDVLSRALDQRFGAFGQGMDQRFGSFGQAMGQRLDALDRMIDERFATVDQRFAARDALLVRLETNTATVAVMDAQLARLVTKTAREFRHLRWGLGIVIALVLGLVTKVILDWAMPDLLQ